MVAYFSVTKHGKRLTHGNDASLFLLFPHPGLFVLSSKPSLISNPGQEQDDTMEKAGMAMKRT